MAVGIWPTTAVTQEGRQAWAGTDVGKCGKGHRALVFAHVCFRIPTLNTVLMLFLDACAPTNTDICQNAYVLYPPCPLPTMAYSPCSTYCTMVWMSMPKNDCCRQRAYMDPLNPDGGLPKTMIWETISKSNMLQEDQSGSNIYKTRVSARPAASSGSEFRKTGLLVHET